MAVNPLLKLPTDARHAYFSFFEIKELCVLSRTCRTFKQFLEHPTLWSKLYQKAHPFAVCKNPLETFRGTALLNRKQIETSIDLEIFDCTPQKNGSYIVALKGKEGKAEFKLFDGKKFQALATSPQFATLGMPTTIGFSRGSSTHMAAVVDTSLRLMWDTNTWERLDIQETTASRFTNCRPFMHDPSHTLFFASAYGVMPVIRTYNLLTKIFSTPFEFGIDHAITSFDIFRSNLLVVAGGSLQRWDMNTGQQVETLGHAKSVVTSDSIASFITSRDLIVGSAIERWDHRMDRVVSTFQSYQVVKSIACQDFIIAYATEFNRVSLYDIRTRKVVDTHRPHFSPGSKLKSLQFCGDELMVHSDSQIAYIHFVVPDQQTAKRTAVLGEMPVAKKAKK